MMKLFESDEDMPKRPSMCYVERSIGGSKTLIEFFNMTTFESYSELREAELMFLYNVSRKQPNDASSYLSIITAKVNQLGMADTASPWMIWAKFTLKGLKPSKNPSDVLFWSPRYAIEFLGNSDELKLFNNDKRKFWNGNAITDSIDHAKTFGTKQLALKEVEEKISKGKTITLTPVWYNSET